MNRMLYFISGAAVGSAVTWYLIKTKYEQLAQEEIDSVKTVFKKKSSEEKSVEPIKEVYQNPRSSADPYEKPSIMEYAAKLAEERYSRKESTEKILKDIYSIPPEEFGELDDYDTISLMYYSDDVLSDEDGELVDDVANSVGVDFDEHFGEYEDDSVFIRNDIRKVDYEVLRSELTYEEATNSKPPRVEVR